MTQNQLKYWELRWKQHYENIMLQLKARELEIELAKLQETKRSNRAKETIQWAELNEKIRAAGVSEALKKESNIIDALKANTDLYYTLNQVQNMLAEQQVAAAEFLVTLEQAKNEDARKWLETEAILLKNGWGEYTVEKAVGEAKASMSDSRYNSILQIFDQGGNSFLQKMAQKYSSSNDLNPYPNLNYNGGSKDNTLNDSYQSTIIDNRGNKGPGYNTDVSDKMSKYNPNPVVNKSKYLGPGVNLSIAGTEKYPSAIGPGITSVSSTKGGEVSGFTQTQQPAGVTVTSGPSSASSSRGTSRVINTVSNSRSSSGPGIGL